MRVGRVRSSRGEVQVVMAALQWMLLHLRTSEASRKDLHIANR